MNKYRVISSVVEAKQFFAKDWEKDWQAWVSRTQMITTGAGNSTVTIYCVVEIPHNERQTIEDRDWLVFGGDDSIAVVSDARFKELTVPFKTEEGVKDDT